MSVRKYDIRKATIPFRGCSDPRWWVVITDPEVDEEDGVYKVVVAPISAQFDMFEEGRDFVIRQGDAAFSDTGLNRESYVDGDYAVVVPVSLLKQRRTGALTGGLLEDFREFADDLGYT